MSFKRAYLKTSNFLHNASGIALRLEDGFSDVKLKDSDIVSVTKRHMQESCLMEIKTKNDLYLVERHNISPSQWLRAIDDYVKKYNPDSKTWLDDKRNGSSHPRRIVCAATMVGDKLLIGIKHGDEFMEQQSRLQYSTTSDYMNATRVCHVNGFLDNFGTFWDAKKALAIAINAEQLNCSSKGLTELKTEHIY